MSVISGTDWAKTIYVNLFRVISSTLTISILYPIGVVSGIINGQQTSYLGALVLPAGLLVVGLAVILVFKIAASINPMLGAPGLIMSLVMVAFIAIGDPLIWIIIKFRPNIIPLTNFGIFNFHAVLLVKKDG